MRQSVSHLLPVNRICKVDLYGEVMNVFCLHTGKVSVVYIPAGQNEILNDSNSIKQ